MMSCAGQLVVHRDGSVAYCSEEQLGGSCAGEDRPHRRGVLACRLVSDQQCPYCASLALTAVSTAASVTAS